MTTGSYLNENGTDTEIPADTDHITLPYFGYHPDQINVTRDMRIMSSILTMADDTKTVAELTPSTN